MLKRNQDIRNTIKQNKLPYWLIAEKMGVHENTVCRMLNKELSAAQKEKILSLVDELKQATK